MLRGPGEYALNNNETGPLGKATWLDHSHIRSYLMLIAGLKHMVDCNMIICMLCYVRYLGCEFQEYV